MNEAGKFDEAKVPAQPHVRKTAMTYSPRMGNKNVEGPALTNDIVIISRAEEMSPMRKLGSLKAGGAPSNIPSIWPVVGTLRSGVGMRNNPFGGSSVEYHKGQDISAPMGTPINVTADGVVVVAGWMKGYGNGIYVDHGNGITTRYGHLSRIDVVVGQTVKRGAHLGLVGSTGRSTGPHLHYEVRINGQPASPRDYLPLSAPQAPAK
jgi:murein DD-endopeptidase MepM/ murein hydrolase activator NlpD